MQRDMSTYRELLAKTLKSITHVGSYAYGHTLHEFCLPSLNVHGVGLVSFPLQNIQAKDVIARCNLAPFGRKEETLYDITVRNTWQLEPTSFTIENNSVWNKFVDRLVEQSRFELGFTDAKV